MSCLKVLDLVDIVNVSKFINCSLFLNNLGAQSTGHVGST